MVANSNPIDTKQASTAPKTPATQGLNVVRGADDWIGGSCAGKADTGGVFRRSARTVGASGDDTCACTGDPTRVTPSANVSLSTGLPQAAQKRDPALMGLPQYTQVRVSDLDTAMVYVIYNHL